MKHFIQQLFKDKLDNYSMREFVIAILLASLIVSWIGKQFFGKEVPEFMFYSFSSLIAAGVFGYTFEKHPPPPAPEETGKSRKQEASPYKIVNEKNDSKKIKKNIMTRIIHLICLVIGIFIGANSSGFLTI